MIAAATLVREPRYVCCDDDRWDENAEFMAAAREIVPKLVEEVAAPRGVFENSTARVQRMVHYASDRQCSAPTVCSALHEPTDNTGPTLTMANKGHPRSIGVIVVGGTNSR